MTYPYPVCFDRIQKKGLYVVYATVGLFFMGIGIRLNKIVSETVVLSDK